MIPTFFFLVATGKVQRDAVKMVQRQAEYNAAPVDKIRWQIQEMVCRKKTPCEPREEEHLNPRFAQVTVFVPRGQLAYVVYNASGSSVLSSAFLSWDDASQGYVGRYKRADKDEEGELVLKEIVGDPRGRGFSGRLKKEGESATFTLVPL